MGKPTDKQECFDEDDWNFSSRPDGGGAPHHAAPRSSFPQPGPTPPVLVRAWTSSSAAGLDSYRYSKLAAEKEAWKLAAEMGLHLATVLPSFIGAL